jgi:hypothetical protein
MATSRLSRVSAVSYPSNGQPVDATAARALARLLSLPEPAPDGGAAGTLRVAVAGSSWNLGGIKAGGDPTLFARIDANGEGEITASDACYLYGFVHYLLDGATDQELARLDEGLRMAPTFAQHRPLFDSPLNHINRSARGFDAEAHIELMARSGFTHVEVNGLASHTPQERGRAGEYYPQFYTYCPGFNHFTFSKLTEGLYEIDYVEANMNRLKRMARIGKKYGLRPGMLCFEPRSMPEVLFERYPTLRGARVDHPFRSWMPRYVLAQDHPVSREHYREVVRNIMSAVPELSYMSIWTNDSGAGFEHTSSLYVGRNGGPYMIREWRSNEAIAKAAGESAVRWLRLVRDTAAEVNPDFEVVLRIEPFKEEHDTIIAGMGDGLTVEAPSLLVRGYELPYQHVRYPSQTSVAGSIYHTTMDDKEVEQLASWRERGFEPKLSYSAGPSFNIEPLIGVPFPKLLHAKLQSLKEMGATSIGAFGGLTNTPAAPYWPNTEVMRTLQYAPDRNIDDALKSAATRWAGADESDSLVDFWSQLDEVVSYIPLVPLYGGFGFPWYRAWVRPLIPNLEAVPKEDRNYYLDFMVTVCNNPMNVDLGKDVLFDLIDQKAGQKMADDFDNETLPRLRKTLEAQRKHLDNASATARPVFTDLYDRTRALLCWATTMRNIVAWVAGVHGFLEADSDADRARFSRYIQEMIDLDMENTRALLDLWENSQTEFMMVSSQGQTAYIYGENLGDDLKRKLELTEKYRHVEPYIAKDIMWRLD